jgi:spore maturation protein CgeB
MEPELFFREEVINFPGIEVYPFGKGYDNNEYRRVSITEKIESVGGVDVILFSVLYKLRWEECFKRSNALKVSIAPDFYEGAYRIGAYEKHYEDIKFDVVFGYGTIVLDYLKKMGVSGKRYYLPFCVNTEFFRKHDTEKIIDVLATYTTQTRILGVYPYRAKIQRMLAGMFMASCVGVLPFENLVKMTNMSKIVVNCNAKYNFINPRVTETMACGSFLLTSYCDDLARFGYKDGEHLITFRDMKDFKDKVNYFLENNEEREEIAENGMRFVRENYSNKKRVIR